LLSDWRNDLLSSSEIDVSETVGNTDITTATTRPATGAYYNVDTSYDDVATPPAARGATCKDTTSQHVDPATILKVDDTETTTATLPPATGVYYNVDTSYDDVAAPPAARGATCKDTTSQHVDPVIILKVDGTSTTTATLPPATGAYYNVDTSYDDVATPPAVRGANDVTGQPVNPEMGLEEKNATASRPMSDRTQYQQLVLIHDQQGIHVVFFPKYQYEIIFL